MACLYLITIVLLVSYICTDAHIFSRVPAHTQIIQYDVTKRRCARGHAYFNTHTHIRYLSISFQIATFGKEYEAVNTMTIYFSMIVLRVSLMIFSE